MKIGIVGSGFSGAVIARELALNGFDVEVFEVRDHIAGNCFTKRDSETNILKHCYGPHIFHTSDLDIWNYINQFDKFFAFTNRVKAISSNKIYSLPINLFTINSFFNKTFSPNEAKEFIREISCTSIENPISFEDQALKFIGKELYEAFFKEYTIKQWGLNPKELPANILKRLPVRFNYDDNYYTSKYQGIPENGYTHVIKKILDHPKIKINLNSKFTRGMNNEFDHVFTSAPLDSWFNFDYGRLSYRTLKFKDEIYEGDYQGNPVINYCDFSVQWTRICEHKHFSPWEKHTKTIITKEYSYACKPNDIPYYPVRLIKDKKILNKYFDAAKKEKKVTFVGRLGTYRYLDMHIAIKEALQAADQFLKK